MSYILLVIAVVIYILLQKVKFENIEVKSYRTEDQDCYDVNLGRRNFTFDNGNVRSRGDYRKRKVIAHFESVDVLDRIG